MPARAARRPASPHRLRPAGITPGLPLFSAALAAAFAGALVAYFLHADEVPAAVAIAALPATPLQPVAAAPAVPPAARPVAVPTAAAASSPRWQTAPGQQSPAPTLAELQELQETLAASSDGSGEFTRFSEQALLADATQRFLQLRASAHADAAELQGLAQLIGPVLDAQLQRGDVAHADALDLKRQLLQALHPQPAVQQAELARWLAAHPAR